MEYSTNIGSCDSPPRFSRHHRHHHRSCQASKSLFVVLISFIIISNAGSVQLDTAPGEGKPINQVSIEFIDLDDGVPSNAFDGGKGHEDQVILGKGTEHGAPLVKPEIIADDDDLLASGSGSGSGDFEMEFIEPRIDGGTLTRTKGFKLSADPQGESNQVLVSVKDDGNTPKSQKDSNFGKNNIVSLRSIEPMSERSRKGRNLDGGVTVFDEDSVYDLPVAAPLNSNDIIINPASWLTWSQWQMVGSSAKVRVRTCQIGDREVSESSCEGARAQMKSCSDAANGACGQAEDISTGPAAMCPDPLDDTIVQATERPSQSPPTQAPVRAPTHAPVPACEYSLYDTYRYKFVFTRWNLTQVMSQSKLKKWCDKTSGQYIVMTTPTRTCRRLYKDLCQAAQKCRSSKPARERGDFAEGCWRGLVYGDNLPMGLSNKYSYVYFICQRFAADSSMGKSFGYKETHFGTLYDTKLRAPIVSLHKMAQVGDETWPDSDYFIEHGLVEEQKDMLWLFRRPRKGMLTLSDLDRCYDDQGCEVGLRQVLPADYDLTSDQARYTPAPLVWPEWMPPSPAPRVSTFTLTNNAPMLTSLYNEWHAKVRSVRRYAIEECGVPYDPSPNQNHVGQMSARRSNKAALYIASGVVPSQHPSRAMGRDVNVPYLFWMAGCCVQQHTLSDATTTNANGNTPMYTFNNLNDEKRLVTNVTSFAMYIENNQGGHVTTAPILELELLLQNIYKVKPSDPEVTLFPGQESVCSGQLNDVSGWF